MIGRNVPSPTWRVTSAQEAGGHDLRIVDDEQVSGRQQVREIPNRPVRERSTGPVHDEQPGRSPVGERLLRDQVLGQLVGIGVGGERVVRIHADHPTAA